MSLEEERAKIVRSWFSGRPAAPFMVQLNPTMACNLNCLFCRRQDELRYYYQHNRELSNPKYLEILDDAVAMGVKGINLKGGGEPLLRRSLIKQMVPRIKEGGMFGSLITNGTLLDEELAELFVKNRWDEISISLDGPDPQTQDALRDKPGAFVRIMLGVLRINRFKRKREQRLPCLKFHLVLTGTNCRCLDRWIRLAHEYGVEEVEVDSLNANIESAKPLVLSPADVAAFQQKLPEWIALAERWGLRHNLRNFFKTEHVQREGMPSFSSNDNLPRPACFFPWMHVSVTPEGSLVPCCYGEGYRSKFSLHEISFREAWFEAGMQEYREAMLDGSMKPFCRGCTAGYMEHNARIRELLAETAYAC